MAEANTVGAMCDGGATSTHSPRNTNLNGGTHRDHVDGDGDGDGDDASGSSESETEAQDESALPPHVIVTSEMVAESEKENAKSLEEIVDEQVAALREADGLDPFIAVVVVTPEMQV
jgi:hypothetical protein